MAFTHLHVHTQYSLLDGACKIPELLDKVKSLGQSSVAVTDHGVMYGVIEFYEEALKRGIKPVIGCECYVAARSRFDKEHSKDAERFHLTLLCKNNDGYRNLIKMVSESWVNGFYTKPRIDRELLEKYHDGIICLSGCLYGEVSQNILRGNFEKAKNTILWYKSVFGEDDYYIEIQNHSLSDQAEVIPHLIRLSDETGVKLCATNDVHYIEKEDYFTQQVLICIATNKTLDTGDFNFDSHEMYLKSEEEMKALFPLCPEAVENSALIAERCNVSFEFGKIKLPFFDIPGCSDHLAYFRQKCFEGLSERLGGEIPQEYAERLDYEIGVVSKMGYVDYYLIVHDFISYAKSKGIPVGPGRGSGAGSLAAYSIGITELDPIKYNLLFERFLNPERVSMPDFDIDFCYIRREEVIEYVNCRYGRDHVAQIVTFGTMAARQAVRDSGRVMGMPYGAVDAVAKAIPTELKITIDQALEKSEELRSYYNDSDEMKMLIDTARKIEGMPRHTSTHAAGVVITDKKVDDYVPLALNDNVAVTQFTMTALEKLGLLKMDFLGLRTLTVIDDAEKLIRKRKPDFSIKNVSLEDKNVFAMLSKGETSGVFQYESAGMRSVLSRLKPKSLEDLIAVVSLYRPGPADSIDTYIENSHHPEKIRYKTPLVKDIFDVTYGCMVYQEQVMQVCRKLAGYSYGRADLVRRAMSKKKADVMENERRNFIYGLTNPDGTVECEGCIKRGVSEEVATEIFDEMTAFARYAFNKSHAACYAYVAYQTAYLKYYYPREFMAATLSSVLDRTDKVTEYIDECKRLHISVNKPDINKSFDGFTVQDNQIYFGLRAIKNVGRGFINRIVEERETGGEYTDFLSFCERLYGELFNKRAVESLIRSGAFDSFSLNRRQMMVMLPDIVEQIERNNSFASTGQMGFFDLEQSEIKKYDLEVPDITEFSRNDLYAMEKELTGLYFSGHPLDSYKDYFKKIKAEKIASIKNGNHFDRDKVLIAGLITDISKKSTKSNRQMAFVTVEDFTDSAECLVFPELWEKNSGIIKKGQAVVVNGTLSLREDQPPSIIVNGIFTPEEDKNPPTDKPRSANFRKGLFLKLPSSSFDTSKINLLCEIFRGSHPVYYYYADTRTYSKQPFGIITENIETFLREMKDMLGADNVVLQL